eukprot:TRINITY_DN3435_c0_g1_i3.p1 TRINITY_DN3435_c0_g1~~TRINITY_DN3435_c0_g1_i3.p1  ORF type:complete len:211 (+),score=44.88 TRINITY_DN3435_c0_g1_i3:100-732(+)
MSVDNSCRVLVSNISPIIEKEHVQELFTAIGPVVSCTLFGDASGKLAIVVYQDPDHAKASLFLSGTPLGDRPLTVAPAPAASPLPLASSFNALDPLGLSSAASLPVPGLGAQPPLNAAVSKRIEETARTIYVGNLDPMVTEDHLRKVFEPCGDILYVKLSGDPQQLNRYAFIEFVRLESANMALALTGLQVFDRPIKVGRANLSAFSCFS